MSSQNKNTQYKVWGNYISLWNDRIIFNVCGDKSVYLTILIIIVPFIVLLLRFRDLCILTHWSLVAILLLLQLASLYYTIYSWLTEPGILPKNAAQGKYTFPQSDIAQRRVSGLMTSVKKNRTDYITVMVLSKAPGILNETNVEGRSIIHLAALLDKPDIAKQLLAYNPDLSKEDVYGLSAFHYASLNKSPDVFNLLCEYSNIPESDWKMKRDEYLQKTKERIPSYDFDHGVFYLDYLGHRVQSRDISVFFIFSTIPSLIQFLNTVNGVTTTTSSSSGNGENEIEGCHHLSLNTTTMMTEIEDYGNGESQEIQVGEGEEMLQPSLVQPLLPSSVIAATTTTTTTPTTTLPPHSLSLHSYPPPPPPPSPSSLPTQLERHHIPSLSISSSSTTNDNNNDNNNNMTMTVDYWEERENREREQRWRSGYRELSYICLCNSHIITLPFCNACNQFSHPRSFHCRYCDICIRCYDHHCPWVSNCIGLRNHRFFIYFLTTCSIYCIFGMSVMSVYFVTYIINQMDSGIPFSIWTLLIETWPCLLYACACIGFLAPVLNLAIYHYRISARNLTTHEEIMLPQRSEVKAEHKTYEDYYVYSSGKKSRNLKNVLFCSTPPSLAISCNV